jgi:hypothetical protein
LEHGSERGAWVHNRKLRAIAYGRATLSSLPATETELGGVTLYAASEVAGRVSAETPSIAMRVIFTTSSGCETIATWLEGTSTVVAPMRFRRGDVAGADQLGEVVARPVVAASSVISAVTPYFCRVAGARVRPPNGEETPQIAEKWSAASTPAQKVAYALPCNTSPRRLDRDGAGNLDRRTTTVTHH